ncbi:DUF5683 domain-containing protein [Spirosoma radiotolerans]|uniref:DUF5683 domain-containing protein n=1 Tax=Spirosoma radiotolerans TaxID=1379870 RepID=A0A0E3V5L7_9BACT|nr:DUF5683 domain-containing protein [Spirosoma radiotolerans]AKD54292.1 hypothetical protein SD10_04580 [Spirosoma radiotolerans]
MKQSFFLLIITLLFCLPIATAFAQRPAIRPAPTPAAIDSSRTGESAFDTIPSTIRRNGVQIQVGKSVLTDDDSTSLDTPDTVQVSARQEAKIHKIIPKKATMRSLVLPGLGQAYNRQYYKIPFIYVGFGVMGYLFVKYRGLAKQAETGYRRLLYGDKVGDGFKAELNPTLYPDIRGPLINTPDQYIKVEEVLIGVSPFNDNKVVFRTTANAKNAYDTFRRYRDLNLLLSGVLWALNIVEANVAAHLKTFDLTDDISMTVEPNVLPAPGMGFIPAVRVAFTFK